MVNGMLLFFPGKNKGMVGLATNGTNATKKLRMNRIHLR
jgi:hypothetical protein